MSRRVPVHELVRLPFADRAEISPAKLRDYVLSADHPDGAAKARWFEDRLGIYRDDWEYLRDQILTQLPTCRIHTLAGKHWRENDRFRCGIECEVHVPILGRHGQRVPILTGWMLDGRFAPRFTTAYST